MFCHPFLLMRHGVPTMSWMPLVVFVRFFFIPVLLCYHRRREKGKRKGKGGGRMTETETTTTAARRSGTLFLSDAEVFAFDFGGVAGQREGSPAPSASSCNSDRAGAAASGGGAGDGPDDVQGYCDAAPTEQRQRIAVQPLDSADVHHAFHATLKDWERVFLQHPPDEAVTKFQVGLQKYGEALRRHVKQQKQKKQQKQRGGGAKEREDRPHKRHRSSNLNSYNNNNSASNRQSQK